MSRNEKKTCKVPSLFHFTVESIVKNINLYECLDNVPEEGVYNIFISIIKKGMLNPNILKLLQDTGHESVLQLIKALDVKDPPVIVRTTDNKWLGQRPSLY